MIPTMFLGGVPTQGAKWDSVDDPYWGQNTLLLRMNGADGSYTFNDSSSFGREVLASNTTDFVVSSAQSKSGGTSCLCNGNGGRLRATNNSSTQLTGDFTLETWVYFGVNTSSQAVISTTKSGPTVCYVYRWSDRKLYFDESGAKISGGTVCTDSAWHHVALTRSGSTIRMWLDGVQEGSTYTSSTTYSVSGQHDYIGSAGDGTIKLGATGADGYVDLVRHCKADRYGTSSFTPPADY